MTHQQHTAQQHRAILRDLARRAMIDRGLLPEFSAAALSELQGIGRPAVASAMPEVEGPAAVRDLTALLWASLDNDDSRDLDQLTVAEALPADAV